MASSQLVARRQLHAKSVVAQPNASNAAGLSYLNLALAADMAPTWGVAGRDAWLRDFYKKEDMLTSAVYTTAGKYASYEWDIDAKGLTAAEVRRRLRESEHGQGWEQLISKVLTDAFTQENGGFIEVLRQADAPSAPFVQLNHLDSANCIRTGRWDQPVTYRDSRGKQHALKWYQVISVTDFPLPEERYRGMQLCAVSRCLAAAQVMRDVATYNQEKVGGRFTREVNVVSGVGPHAIEDAMETQQAQDDAAKLTKFSRPVILTAINPRAVLNHIRIALASLPDGWDEETFMRWYIVKMALAFGQDPQDFAPLPGHNLGSSQQSEILHRKARSKGAALFMKYMEHALNFQGVLPETSRFVFEEQDSANDLERARSRLLRAQDRAIRLKSGEINDVVSRQLAVDDGDMPASYLEFFGEKDLTGRVLLGTNDPLPAPLDGPVPPPKPTLPPTINIPDFNKTQGAAPIQGTAPVAGTKEGPVTAQELAQTAPITAPSTNGHAVAQGYIVHKQVEYDESGKIVGVTEYHERPS